MKNILIISLLALGGFVISSCSKDEPIPCIDETNVDCPNYNPCIGEKPTSAEFETAIVLASNTNTFVISEQDSFYLGAAILFTAKEENALSYKWTVGADERVFTEQEFSLRFNYSDSASLLNRPSPIQLIVTRTPNTECFPLDDGIDTITKYIYLISQHEQSHRQFRGTWIGSMEHAPDDIYEIKMYDEVDPFSNPWRRGYYNLIIENFDNEGDKSCRYEIEAVDYKSFYDSNAWMQNFVECQRSSGVQPLSIFGRIDEKETLRIEWIQRTLEGENLERVFNGRRK